jgi:hypothetical protein
MSRNLVDNFLDLNSAEDFPDFFPGHGPHCGNVGQAVGNQEFPHVEVEAALSVRIEAGMIGVRSGRNLALLRSYGD